MTEQKGLLIKADRISYITETTDGKITIELTGGVGTMDHVQSNMTLGDDGVKITIPSAMPVVIRTGVKDDKKKKPRKKRGVVINSF